MAKAPAKKQDDQTDLLDQIGGGSQEDRLKAGLGALPENQEEVEAEVVVEEEEVAKPDEASVLLQKQIDALKKSEEIQKGRVERYRAEAEEHKRAAAASQVEVGKTRKDAVQAQFDAVSTAIAASTSEVESAKRDIKTAAANQDFDAQADAYDRLAQARANIANLESTKYDLEARLKAPPQQEQPAQVSGLPPRIRRWLDKHPDYERDPRKNDRLRSLHWEVIDEGHEFDSDEYIESMETKLGIRKAETVVEQPKKEEVQPQRSSVVSAPVSRETVSNGGDRGSVTLTPAQRDAAKIAGVTEKVYAENLVKINKMKANGTYGG